MKPVNIGGHPAYQKRVLEQLRKYYPDAASSLSSSTWEILEKFYALDLSAVDEIMQDRYSVFGPAPRLPSDLLRSVMLSIEFKITSVTAWVADMRENHLHALLSGFNVGDTPGIGTFYDFFSRLWCSDKNNLTDAVHPPKEKPKKPKGKRHHITPFIDLNGKGGRPPVYKDDFTIDDDGVPICKQGSRMRRDGTESIKGRTKFKCPKISFKGGSITCTCEHPCSDAKYGRTVHLVQNDNPRLFNDPPRSSNEWKLEYNARTSAERCNKREKIDYKLENGRHRSTKMWYCRLFAIMMCQHLDAYSDISRLSTKASISLAVLSGSTMESHVVIII